MLRAFASILTMADTHGDVESVVHNVVNSPQFRSLVADVIESSNHATNLTQTEASSISQNQSQPKSAKVAGNSAMMASASKQP
jgi:hypothetical protein